MQRLRAAEHRGQRLQRDPGQVDLGLLGGELDARRSGCGSAASASAGRRAPNSSRMMRAHSRRAARNLATSSSRVVRATKKNDSRGAKSSTARPDSMAARTYSRALASVKAISCTGVAPASAMW